MTQDEAFELITAAVAKVKGNTEPTVGRDTDLVESGILDSLDGMVFLMELEQAAGVKFPEEGDLVALGYYKVPHLLRLLSASA